MLKKHKIDLSRKDGKGFTLLHYAAMNGHGDVSLVLCAALTCRLTVSLCKVSKLLLESGADPNIQDSVGRTALHYSMPAGFSSCVRIYCEVSSCFYSSVYYQVVHLMNHGANDGIRVRPSCHMHTLSPDLSSSGCPWTYSCRSCVKGRRGGDFVT